MTLDRVRTALTTSTRPVQKPLSLLGVVLCAALGIVVLQAAPSSAIDQAEPAGLSVLELFVSQSCGSCPPAMILMEELAQRPGVLALSFGVDHFDHLDWKDTLAKPAFSSRQRTYNRQHGKPGIFIPQMVIGGKVDVVGSNRQDVEAAMAQADIKARPLSITMADRHFEFSLPEMTEVTKGTISLIHFRDNVVVPIAAGENRGKTLRYPHAVTDIMPVAQWDGRAQHFTISRDQLCDQGNALLVQDVTGGAILFAALITTDKTL